MHETVLHIAARVDNAEFIEYALASGATLYALDAGGRTAMHKAAIFGAVKAIVELHDQGLDVDVQDDVGNTPLHWAFKSSEAHAVRCLYELGANLDALNKNGNTPPDVAESEEVVELLRTLRRRDGIELEPASSPTAPAPSL